MDRWGEERVAARLKLHELLRKHRKTLPQGKQGPPTLRVLCVSVGGSREALSWALEQNCSVFMAHEHRVLGTAMRGP